MNNIKFSDILGPILVTVIMITSCGGRGGESAEPTGIDRIIEYAEIEEIEPILQDYIDANVTGIDNGEKLAEINEVVEGLVGIDVDTTEEIQALVDVLWAKIDSTKPIITIIGKNPELAILGKNYIDSGATAVDDIDGNLSISSTGDVNSSRLGKYSIIYRAKDSAGNTATATRIVEIVKIEDLM